ncbi:MAG: SDR family oxidoreductase [Planctomycetota bacterium]|jgi:NAD(P)-dependent dehydrogenase (short-subunit alcohol dehydrogenase family)
MADTALVTGADKGLGFSLAKVFLEEGFEVFAGRYMELPWLDELAEANGERLSIVPLDVTDMESVRQAARCVSEQCDGLDVLLNSAGVCLDFYVKVEDTNFRDAGRMMEVNAFGPLRMVQQFLPLLKRGRRKTIVNVSSEAGSIGDCERDFRTAYGMSKAALNMASKMLLNRLGPEGFRVLAVDPGWMQTDMGGPEATLHPDQSARDIYRLATDESAAGGALFASHDGRALNF